MNNLRHHQVSGPDIAHPPRRDGEEAESCSADDAEPRYNVIADPMLKIEPGVVGSEIVGIVHADRAIVSRGYYIEREGDTVRFELCSGPLEDIGEPWCCHILEGGRGCPEAPTHSVWHKDEDIYAVDDYCAQHLAEHVTHYCEVWPIGFDQPPAPHAEPHEVTR